LAVVTEGNKGIGLEICRKLASNEVLVILAAGYEKNSLEAVQKFKERDGDDPSISQGGLDEDEPATKRARGGGGNGGDDHGGSTTTSGTGPAGS
ncbi:hypothetical protein GIB67_009635, partial [Kingdonia uniflora]